MSHTEHDRSSHEQGVPRTEEHLVDVGSAPAVTPMTGRKLGIIAGASAAVLVALLVATIVPRRSVSQELRAEAAGRDSAPVVQVTTVRRAETGSTLSLPSTIQALHESAVYARVGGYVKRWYADIGSVVHAGQTLVEIDAPELQQEVQQARSQVLQAKAALGLAKADLDRWRALARDSAVTGQELDQKRAAFDASSANTAATEANLRRLEQMGQYTRVVAPFTGVVTARTIDIGSLISAGGATNTPVVAGGGAAVAAGSLYRIAETDTVRTYLTVPESYATSIRVGLTAIITVQGIPGRRFTGVVARTSSSLDATSRTLLTEVDVPNRDFALLPGMYARAELTFPRVSPPLVLPANALLVRSSGVQVVEVVPDRTGQNATLHFRRVQLARDYGGTVELADGVSEGTVVVLNPNAELTDGARVRVQKVPAARAP